MKVLEKGEQSKYLTPTITTHSNNIMNKVFSISLATFSILNGILLGDPCMAQIKDTDEGFVPFDVSKAGASASIEFHVGWLYRDQPRQLYLTIKPFGEWQQEDSDFYQLMKSLVGDGNLWGGKPSKSIPHKGIRTLVTWKEKNSQEIVKSTVVYRDRLGSHSNFNEINIDYANLPIGDYIVTITALDNDLRFNDQVKVFVALRETGWFKK